MSKYALCIGINDYPGTNSDLSGCVNDARDWAAELKRRGYTTDLMLDSQATGDGMRNAIRRVIHKANAGESVVIQFSGHGSFVPDQDGDESDGTDECLCPYDLQTNGFITDDELYELYMDSRRDVRIVMISDSCHSGSVARYAPIVTPPTTRGANSPQRTVRFLPPETFLPAADVVRLGVRRALRRSSPPGRYGALLLAGCQDTEYSYDAWFQGRANGAFTFVALRALKRLHPGATYADWHSEILKVLPSRQYAQTPNLFGSAAMKTWAVFELASRRPGSGSPGVPASGNGGKPGSGRGKRRTKRSSRLAFAKSASANGHGRSKPRKPTSGAAGRPGSGASGRPKTKRVKRPRSGR